MLLPLVHICPSAHGVCQNNVTVYEKAASFCVTAERKAGLPLGPLNPLKSLFKHLVPNVPKSQKVVPKVPISV